MLKKYLWIIPIILYVIIISIFYPVRASERSDAFEKQVFFIIVDHGYAKAASMCGLRSDYWWESLNTGVILYIQQEAAAYNSQLSPVEKANSQKRIEEIENTATNGAFKNHCSALQEHQEIMQRLDKLQYTLTGGYH